MCFGTSSFFFNLSTETLINENDNFFNRISFLFAGEDSHQRYVDKKHFDKKRISVIRGRVLSSLGGALSGVRVSDERNPYAGFSITRNDNDDQQGTFDLAVSFSIKFKIIFLALFLTSLLIM